MHPGRPARAARLRRVAIVLVAAGALGAASLHCSLGLDESKLNPKFDAGVGTDGTLDGSVVPDTGTGIPTGPDAGACTTDDNCTSTHGCLRGRCDQTRKTCVYDVCHFSACSSSVCDRTQRTCGPPATNYRLRAAQFSLGAPLACAGCAAALYPWFFALVPTGLIALDVSNPAGTKPAQIPVSGLGFVPTRIVASGRRLWMLGTDANGTRVSVAYLDAPVDPFVTEIKAVSATTTTNRAPGDTFGIIARGGDSALLLGTAATQFPAAVLDVPVPATVTTTTLAPTATGVPVIMSGTRLLMAALNGNAGSFSFVLNAGGPPAVGPASTVDGVDVSTSRAFAASPDGAVFWVTGVHLTTGAAQQTRAVRGYFLVPNATGAIDTRLGFDIESYEVGGVGTSTVAANAPVVGPAAMLDAKTAIVVTQAKEADTSSAVQFGRLTPLGVIKEADTLTPRRVVVPIPVAAFVAATASNGLAYLVTTEGAGVPSNVLVFDPACAP
jgi:hypothetical protein